MLAARGYRPLQSFAGRPAKISELSYVDRDATIFWYEEDPSDAEGNESGQGLPGPPQEG